MRQTARIIVLVLSGIVIWNACGRAPAADEHNTIRAVVSPAQRLPGNRVGFEPVVAADGDGRVVAVASSFQGQGLLVWRSEDSGKTFASPQPAIVPENAVLHQGDPPLRAVGG